MPWESSDRRDQLPSDWASIRREVFRRKGKRCVWRLPSGRQCPRPATDIDHIRGGDDHRISNLRPLCEHHHKKRTAQQAIAARKGRYRIKRRPVEDDPGALG